jgi:hypothetical protein
MHEVIFSTANRLLQARLLNNNGFQHVREMKPFFLHQSNVFL